MIGNQKQSPARLDEIDEHIDLGVRNRGQDRNCPAIDVGRVQRIRDHDDVRVADRFGSKRTLMCTDPIPVRLEQTGERVIPGLTDYSLYIPHIKRYTLTAGLSEGARVLDAGCGTGYGSRLLARVARQVDAVDVSQAAVDFARKTYDHDRINWRVDDLRSFEPERNAAFATVSEPGNTKSSSRTT